MVIPLGVLLGIFGGGVPPTSPKPDPISDQKLPFSTPAFRPDLENIHRFSDMALESRHIINNSLLHYPSEVTTMFVVFVQTGNAFFVD